MTLSAGRTRLRQFEVELLHIPCTCGTAFRTKPAVEADILVLCHNPACPQSIGDIDVLGGKLRRSIQACAKLLLFAILRKRDAIHRTDINASIAFNTLLRGKYGLDVAIEATLGLFESQPHVETQFHFHLDIFQ